MYNIFMVKLKFGIFAFLILFFLLFSFAPTIFEVSQKDKLKDPNREFILEHNYYWPDFNLYLSKIRQGHEGGLTAVEKYTSEPHQGSLIQIFYVYLGHLGQILGTDPNGSYHLGRIILTPLLLLIVMLFSLYYFKSPLWQILSFIIIVVSGSFPRIYTDPNGFTHIGRYMEWWSNIDALQRIAFIPHILFGQIFSFLVLYKITIKSRHKDGIHDAVIPMISGTASGHLTFSKIFIYALLGNVAGLVFPPSLITLDAVVGLLLFVRIAKAVINKGILRSDLLNVICYMLYVLFTLPTLLYFAALTKQVPWNALVIAHQLHPMLIPFDQYFLGTGPILILALGGIVVSLFKRDWRYHPLIFWMIATFTFAIIFTHIREQSPLRFTQTGLFIPLGLLGTYFLYQVFHLSDLSDLGNLGIKAVKTGIAIFIGVYILGSLFIMKTSLDWQIVWLKQLIGANIPAVPFPPQSMFPLKLWMDGIRYLRDNTDHNDVVLAGITAANHIPAYSGNFVYFGQTNTVNYESKEQEMMKFFKGEMSSSQAENLFQRGRIKYIFYSVQEKEFNGSQELTKLYPFIKPPIFSNDLVNIYSVN